MPRRQLAVYRRRGFTEEAIEVGARSYRSRGPERTVPRRQLAVYSRGALQRRKGRGGEAERRRGGGRE